jgi:hypothetical protein
MPLNVKAVSSSISVTPFQKGCPMRRGYFSASRSTRKLSSTLEEIKKNSVNLFRSLKIYKKNLTHFQYRSPLKT